MRLLTLTLLAVSASAQTPSVPPTPTPDQVAHMEATLQDWPNLTRYRAEDEALPPPTPGQPRVIFLGDSLTDNWGRRFGKFFPGKGYINRGISGQTAPQMLARMTQDVLPLHPDILVLLAGTNDLARNTGPESIPQIEAYLAAIVNLARSAGIRVIVCSILPADHFPWRAGITPAQDIRTLNQWLAAFAARSGLAYVDYYSALATPGGAMRPELAVDHAVHPNDAGYALMEPLAQAAIDRTLASSAHSEHVK